MVRAKIDLRPRVEGYALYEVIGNNGKYFLLIHPPFWP